MNRLLFLLACSLALNGSLAAHVTDEYLETTQIEIATDRLNIELRLTPGVEVAEKVLAVIDADKDGQISTAEERAYVESVIKDLSLDSDGRKTPFTIQSYQFPLMSEMKAGLGTVTLELVAKAYLDSAGSHKVSVRNDHLPDVATYQANALVPTNTSILITKQDRDRSQHSLTVDFQLTSTAEWPTWMIAALAGSLSVTLLLLFAFLEWKGVRSLGPK